MCVTADVLRFFFFLLFEEVFIFTFLEGVSSVRVSEVKLFFTFSDKVFRTEDFSLSGSSVA